MKFPLRVLITGIALFFFTIYLGAQCPIVIDGSFTVTFVEKNPGCDWTLEFDIDNSTSDGTESMAYSIFVNDVGNDDLFYLVNEDPLCSDPISTPTHHVTVLYSGSCLAFFDLEWKSFDEDACPNIEPCATNLTPTPVELTAFTGTTKNGTVELNWTTESEENNRLFEIQRSEDGKNFENIGMIEGRGTTETAGEYSFLDKKPLPHVYYRLKQVDFSGYYAFSNIIIVKRGDFESKLIVYPTQAFNEVTLRIETLDSRKSYLKIANTSGRIIHQTVYYGANDAEYLTLDTSNYPPGIYYVSLSNNKETVTAKFVIVED